MGTPSREEIWAAWDAEEEMQRRELEVALRVELESYWDALLDEPVLDEERRLDFEEPDSLLPEIPGAAQIQARRRRMRRILDEREARHKLAESVVGEGVIKPYRVDMVHAVLRFMRTGHKPEGEIREIRNRGLEQKPFAKYMGMGAKLTPEELARAERRLRSYNPHPRRKNSRHYPRQEAA